jgi:hypothetical protein
MIAVVCLVLESGVLQECNDGVQEVNDGRRVGKEREWEEVGGEGTRNRQLLWGSSQLVSPCGLDARLCFMG